MESITLYFFCRFGSQVNDKYKKVKEKCVIAKVAHLRL